MPPNLSVSLARLTKLATEVLEDHLGMIAPLIAEEVAADVLSAVKSVLD